MSHFQLERILHIHQCIYEGDYPHPDTLAEELEVSRRQIYDDRNFLLSLGADIRFDRKRGGWYYVKPWQLPVTTMMQGNLLAFFLSLEIVRRYRGTPLELPLRSTVENLTKHLTDVAQVDLHTLSQCYTFTPPPSVSIDEHTLMELYLAIRNQQQVWFRYYWIERNETVEIIAHPHALHSFQENWFLIAFDPKERAMQTYHIGRIRAYRVLTEAFQPVSDFDAAEWIASTFQGEHGTETVTVQIRFDAYQARFVREQDGKYQGQQIEELPDGGVILSLSTSGLGRLKRWVLSFGRRAEVLSPAFLREEIVDELQHMATLYPSHTEYQERHSSDRE